MFHALLRKWHTFRTKHTTYYQTPIDNTGEQYWRCGRCGKVCGKV